MSKILVVDDDYELAQSIRESLTAYGFVVDSVLSAKDAEDMLRVSEYDLIILDWMMPVVRGIDLLRKLRDSRVLTPVLMLTGMDSIENKTTGLDTGADDYLTKPFNTKEMLARVRALLRRPQSLIGSQIKSGNFCLDLQARKLFCGENEIKLTKTEFLLLEFLMRHPNHVFDAEALVERAWSTLSESSPDTVRVHVARLRKKLELEGSGQCPIKTLHGQGYSFVSES